MFYFNYIGILNAPRGALSLQVNQLTDVKIYKLSPKKEPEKTLIRKK